MVQHTQILERENRLHLWFTQVMPSVEVPNEGLCLCDGVQVYEGRVGSLKRHKDDAREVTSGFECGIGLEGYNDVKIGDMIETYELSEKPATLE